MSGILNGDPAEKKPRYRLAVALTFSILLLCSLAIPAVHYFLADQAIANIRQVWTEPDGVATPLLTHLLFLKFLDRVAWAIPVFLSISFLLSFKIEHLTRFSTLVIFALAECVFVTLYAAYCCRVFSHFMLGLPS